MNVSVAILDNELNFLNILKLMLQEHFSLDATHDTNEFIRNVKQPAVLVVDWHLDYGATGIDVMRKVRETNPLTVFIFISNVTTVDILLEVIKEGWLSWGCYFLEKDKSNFIVELVDKIKIGRQILKDKLAQAKEEIIRTELLNEKISQTVKAIEEINGGSN